MRICVLGSAEREREELARLAAEGGNQAIAHASFAACNCAAAGNPCDVVLIDAGQEPAACDLCREIAAARTSERPYIIMINLPPAPGAPTSALEAGADDILQSPLDGERLATRLEVARRRLAQYAEGALAGTSAEAIYQALFKQKLDAVFVSDAAGRYLDVNEAACEMTGYSRDELLGMSVFDLVDPDDAARNPVRLSYLAAGGALTLVERRFRRKDGSIIVAETSVCGISGGRILAISRDISERKRHEAALRASEERFRALYERTPVMLHSIDREGRLVAASDHILDVLGYEREEVLGRLTTDFITPESAELARNVVLPEFLRTGSYWNAPYQMVKRNGEIIDVLTSTFMLPGDQGRQDMSLSISIDVTARLQAERALRESEERLRLILDVSPDLVGWVDLGGRLVFANAAHTAALGWDPAEFAGKNMLEMIHPEDLPAALEAMQRSVAGEPERQAGTVFRFRRADGAWAPLEMRSRALPDAGGKPAGLVVVSRDVSERLAYEDALRAANNFRELVMESATNAIYALDLEGRFTFVNRRVTEITGYPEDELLGQPSGIVFDPGPLALATEQFEKAAKFGERVSGFEVELRQKSGALVTISFSYTPLIENGNITGVVGTAEDITARKQAVEALRERERALTTLIANLPGAAYRCRNDSDWTMEFLSDGCFDLTGYPAADFLSPGKRTLAALQHPADRDAVWDAVQAALLRREPFELTYRITTAWGEERRVWERGQGVFDDEGNPVAIEGFLMDVTERERALSLLHQSEERYRRLVESSPVAMVVHQDGIVRFASQAALAMFGVPPGTPAEGLRVASFVSPEDMAAVAEDARLLTTAVTSLPPAERHLLRVDGEAFEAEITVAPTEFEGRPAVLAVLRDLAEQRRAEEVMRRTSEQYRRLVHVSPIGMAVVQGGMIVFANRECLRVFGVPSLEEVIGTPLFAFVADEGRREADAWVTAFREGGGQLGAFEARVRRRNGEVFDVEAFATAILYDGAPAALLVIRDLSRQKRAEEERLAFERRLLETQKLESLGVLAGGVAHDFNNLLVAIMGNASLSLMELGDSSSIRPYVEEIELAAQRAADLARQMLAYSGKGRLAVSRVHLNELVSEMGKLVSVSIPRKVLLEWQLAGELPPVEADATQLRQVVMNLVINAAEAIGDHEGVIRVSTGAMRATRDYLKSTFLPFDEIAEGDYVFFEVADTGVGMDAETIERIFDPFFTTKFTGRGLGMAAVLGIVRGHRGAIRVESEKGKGTTIRVLLPPAEAATPAVAQPPSPAAGASHRGHVLVIDDEASIRAVAARMLQRMGFEVTAVADGAAGIEKFRQEYAGLVAVLLDLTMPRMSGVEAFEHLQAIAPGVPVVAMSGYSQEVALGMFSSAGPRAFLQKPFSMADLEAALSLALAPGG